MIRVTGFIHVESDTEPSALDELTELLQAAPEQLNMLVLAVSPTKPQAHRAGQLMVLAAFPDMAAFDAARRHPYLKEVVRPRVERLASRVEVVRYRQGPTEVREPDLAAGVQRTLLIHVQAAADPSTVTEFEKALAAMPRYIEEIRNSSLSHVDQVWGSSGQPWTHVWEQEFLSLDGLLGPYMTHAYHWAHVDTWFDPQSPNHIVDTTLVHAMCDLDRSILALER